MSTDRNVLRGLEEAANRGLDVRVMLEPDPFGGGSSPSKTLDTLAASGIKTQSTNPSFPLTHEKGMIIDDIRKIFQLNRLTTIVSWGLLFQIHLP
jgi:cardiolipin synthase A/B